MVDSNLPTYREGDSEIVVMMLDQIIINNILYKQSCRYKLPVWIAKELCEMGYCVYQIKPEDL